MIIFGYVNYRRSGMVNGREYWWKKLEIGIPSWRCWVNILSYEFNYYREIYMIRILKSIVELIEVKIGRSSRANSK